MDESKIRAEFDRGEITAEEMVNKLVAIRHRNPYAGGDTPASGAIRRAQQALARLNRYRKG